MGSSGRARALCVMIAARLPPAEEPPVESLLVLMNRWEAVWGEMSQRRASQQSWTAAGKGFSGASLDRVSKFHIAIFRRFRGSIC
jgi:hypothetical protein